MPAPVSQAQARLFGAIAGGALRKPGFPKSEAKARLRGVDVSRLPARKRTRDLKSALLARE